jgi:hypothetical protein
LSGDRERDVTYLGRGITGPGDKGPVVRGQGEGHHVTSVAGVCCHLLACIQKHEILFFSILNFFFSTYR